MHKPMREWTKKELRALPYARNWLDEIGPFESLIVLPESKKALHDSGYRFIRLFGVTEQGEILSATRRLDHICIDKDSFTASPYSISFDALTASGAIRLWCNNHLFTISHESSSVYIKPVPKGVENARP